MSGEFIEGPYDHSSEFFLWSGKANYPKEEYSRSESEFLLSVVWFAHGWTNDISPEATDHAVIAARQVKNKI